MVQPQSQSTLLSLKTLARLGALLLDEPYMLLATGCDLNLKRWMIVGQRVYLPDVDRFSRHLAEVEAVKQPAESNKHVTSAEMPSRTDTSSCDA